MEVSNVESNFLATALLLSALALLLWGVWPQAQRLRHGEDFRVTLLEDEWDNYQLWGHILQVKIRVENLTGKRKRITTHKLAFDGVGPAPALGQPGGRELLQEAEARKHNLQLMNASVVDPLDTVGGWHVFRFGDLDPQTFHYKLFVTDEMGKDYEARRRPRLIRWFS